MADDDLFDALRDAGRSAVVPEATTVRARGRQRQVRSRALYAGTAVVVLVAGTGLALAAAGGKDDAVVIPAATPSATATAEPTRAPTPVAHVSVDLTITRITTGGFHWVGTYDGEVPAVYGLDGGTSPEPRQQLTGSELTVDGVQQSASDEGEQACRPEAPLVPAADAFNNDLLLQGQAGGPHGPLSRGQHTATWTVYFCKGDELRGASYSKTVTFTVS